MSRARGLGIGKWEFPTPGKSRELGISKLGIPTNFAQFWLVASGSFRNFRINGEFWGEIQKELNDSRGKCGGITGENLEKCRSLLSRNNSQQRTKSEIGIGNSQLKKVGNGE